MNILFLSVKTVFLEIDIFEYFLFYLLNIVLYKYYNLKE